MQTKLFSMSVSPSPLVGEMRPSRGTTPRGTRALGFGGHLTPPVALLSSQHSDCRGELIAMLQSTKSSISLLRSSSKPVGRPQRQATLRVFNVAELQRATTAPPALELSTSLASNISSFKPSPAIEEWTTRDLPLEESSTPPASWYTSPEVAELEKTAIFDKNWLYVGHIGQVASVGDFFTGEVSTLKYLVVKGADGELNAFHNVCRHKAAPVAFGSGCTSEFSCPYHGWKYCLEGRFRGATKLGGVKNFTAQRNSLLPLRLETFGSLIFVNADLDCAVPSFSEWLGRGGEKMREYGMDNTDLVHAATYTYQMAFNWKVYADNYLDTCYHCPFAHPGLSDTLDLNEYHSVCYEHTSFQISPWKPAEDRPPAEEWDAISGPRFEGGDDGGPKYAYVYPNLMVNRHGLFQVVVRVLPGPTPDKSVAIMDYWCSPDKVNDKAFVDALVQGDKIVQEEDMMLCDWVQSGLHSKAYGTGRYVPSAEEPVWHFHKQLQEDYFPTK